MTKDDRIYIAIEPELKAKYIAHAEKAHGMDLSTWVRMLLHRDFLLHSDE